jgi:hypothetical protein
MTAGGHAERLEHAGGRPEGSQRHPYRLSRLTAAASLVLFLLGLAKGATAYRHRSTVPEPHAVGTNAITIQVLLAIAAVAVVAAVELRRSRLAGGRGPSPWTAPFSAAAIARLGRTFRFARGLSLPNVARALLTVPLLLVLAYVPFRLGTQIIGGFDPNATVNAWGGPTYLGALLAHWLDGLVGFYAAAFLLGWVLLPPPATGKDQTRPD